MLKARSFPFPSVPRSLPLPRHFHLGSGWTPPIRHEERQEAIQRLLNLSVTERVIALVVLQSLRDRSRRVARFLLAAIRKVHAVPAEELAPVLRTMWRLSASLEVNRAFANALVHLEHWHRWQVANQLVLLIAPVPHDTWKEVEDLRVEMKDEGNEYAARIAGMIQETLSLL